MPDVQPVFDIVAAAKVSATVLESAVANVSNAIGHCYKEDVQPTVLLPLESLGRWLMVDPDRLHQGEQALKSIPEPKSLDWKSILIRIGLETHDGRGSFAQTIARSNC
jgi:hypothetical protein